MNPETTLGQPGWTLRSDRVSLAVTCLGGFLGPVDFRIGRRRIRPGSLPPWAGRPDAPTGALGALRGDVFCLPFGDNRKPFRGESHPPHGDTFQGCWNFLDRSETPAESRLLLEIPLRVRSGLVRKELVLRRGHPVVYQRHLIHGLSGPMSFGYHATLDFGRHGPGRIALSPILFGRTQLADFEDPARGGYCSFRPASVFRRLDAIPRSDGTVCDLTRYPVDEGFENLALVAADPRRSLAWSTVVFPRAGWLWFSLKLPRELGCTLFWLSNGGRHYPPWNGRHRGRLGIEEVTALPEGLAEAVAPNDFSRRGIPVCRNFSADHSYVVRSATGICPIPPEFDVVKQVRLRGSEIVFTARSGARASVPFDAAFFSPDDAPRNDWK